MKHTECKEKGHTISLTLTIALENYRKMEKSKFFRPIKKNFVECFCAKEDTIKLQKDNTMCVVIEERKIKKQEVNNYEKEAGHSIVSFSSAYWAYWGRLWF